MCPGAIVFESKPCFINGYPALRAVLTKSRQNRCDDWLPIQAISTGQVINRSIEAQAGESLRMPPVCVIISTWLRSQRLDERLAIQAAIAQAFNCQEAICSACLVGSHN